MHMPDVSGLFFMRTRRTTIKHDRRTARFSSQVEGTTYERPPSFRSERNTARNPTPEPRRSESFDFHSIDSRDSQRCRSQNAEVPCTDVVLASMRQKIEAMQRALDDKESQLEDIKTNEQVGHDRADRIALERAVLWARLERRDSALNTQKARVEELERAREDFEGQAQAMIGTLEDTIRRQRQEAKASRAEVADVNNRMESTLRLLESRTQELKGAQAFVTKADSYSGADVIALVKSLNEEIFQLSAFMTDDLPMSGDVPPTGDEHMIEEKNLGQYLGARLCIALVSMVHADDPTALQFALQCFLARASKHIIGTWTVDDSLPDILTLYGKVRDEGEDIRFQRCNDTYLHPKSVKL